MFRIQLPENCFGLYRFSTALERDPTGLQLGLSTRGANSSTLNKQGKNRLGLVFKDVVGFAEY